MGGAQSAQREDKDSAAEESGALDDAQPEQHAEDKSLKNNGQISEISGKADATVAGINSRCEEEVAAEAIVSPDEDVSAAEKPLKEMNEHESPNEADANEEVTLETIEMDAKHNDINESFRRFFSNINLKVTVKRGSVEKDDTVADVSGDATKEESTRPEGPAETAKEDTNENAEINVVLNTEQEPYDHDATCPTLADIKSEDVQEEKTTETKGEAYCENAGPAEPAPVGDDESVQQTATSGEEMVVSPVKRFFTTGIFSGLRKKKKSLDGTAEKELVDMRKAEVIETAEDKEISPSAEADGVQTQHKENGLKDEVLSAAPARTADEDKPPSTDPSAIIVNEPEIISSQEKDKVQASPLKRLLSGSSFKKPSKKQRERKSSEAKLSDSGEYVSNQLPPSTDAAENQKGESPAGEEDGAWASFKKLMTPKKRTKRSSLSNEETQTSGLAQESKSSEGEQMSDNSTEENKKRKDSSVSWEAVLCGSGRRRSRSRSRRTSDSEDEKPQEESDNRKKESPLESSNETDKSPTTHSKHEGSASEGDGGSTWKSIKKLVTPKRRVKDEDLQSDGEATQEDSSFSIKKLLPGQKKRKPAEKQDYVSSDEADKEVASCDEDSETPAVVPLSEFDAVDTGVHLETHADVERHISLEADYKLQEDLDKTSETGESLQSEAKPVQDNEDALENEAPTAPASNEEPDETTELISKHQQLSDIPEEGIITETMVTPGSVPEQPARDDTIAEDLIEITSEAITAPEPVDVTMADDTEMISAVSQLSDSSKTSGNTTPVPVEYNVKDTEVLLQQVAESIYANPKADPLCSDEISSERIVASVSYQILETFVKQQPTILEIHRRSDATAFKTGLNIKVLDDIKEHAATAQTESIAEVNEVVYTEIVSEVPTELNAAESAVDDIHEVSVTQTEESMELESANKSQDLTKYQAEYEASTENLSEGEEIVQCSIFEAHQAETETLQTEFIDGAVTQEVQTLLKAQDEIVQKLTDQLQAEEVVQELQELAAAERDTSGSEKDIVEPPENTVAEEIPAVEEVTIQLKDVELEKEDELQEDKPAALDSDNSGIQIHEKQVALPEDAPAAETGTDEPEPFPEVHVEPEKEDGLQTDAAKTEHDQVSAAHEATLDTETLGREEQTSHSIQTEEQVTDQCKELPQPLTETDVESEKKQADSAKTEDGQEPEVHNVQDPVADPQVSSIQIIKKEALLSVETKPELEATDEPKGQPESLLKLNANLKITNELQAECEHGAAPEVLDGQTDFRDLQKDDVQTLEKEVVVSEDTPPAETVTDKQEDQPESLTQGNVELEREDGQQSEIPEEQATALPSQIDTTYVSEKEVTLCEDMTAEETDEPRHERDRVNEAHVDSEKNDDLRADVVKLVYEQDLDVLDAKETALVSEGSIQTPGGKVLSENIEPEEEGKGEPHTDVNAEPEDEYKLQTEDVLPGETVTEEPEEKSVTEISMELERKELHADAVKAEHVSEIYRREEETIIDKQIGTIQREVPLSEDVPPGETITGEPKKESEPVTDNNMEQEQKELQADAVKPDHEEDPDVLDVKEIALVSEGSIQTPGGKVPLSVDIPPGETVTDEPKEESVTEINMEIELQADAAKPEQAEVSEIYRGEEETVIDEQIATIQIYENKVPPSEDVQPGETVTEEPTEPVTEISMEVERKELQADVVKSDHEQDPDVLDVKETALVSEGSIQTPGGKVLSENIEPEEGGKDEPHTDVNAEPEDEYKLHAEDVRPGETVTEEPEEESVTEISMELERKELHADAVKSDHEQDPDVFNVKETELISEGSIQTSGCRVPLSDIISPGETFTDEPKEESVTEINIELERKELQADAVKYDHSDVKETALVMEGSIQRPGSKVLSENIEPEEEGTDEPHTDVNAEPEDEYKLQAEDVLPGETVTGEPKKESEPVNEINMELEKKQLQADVVKSDHEQDPDVLDVKETALVSEGSIQTPGGKVLSENIEPEEEGKDEPHTDVNAEPEDEYKLQAEDVLPGETVTGEPKKESEPVNEINMELERKELQADVAKIEDSEVLAAQGAALDSGVSGIEIPENETPSQNTPPAGTVTDQHVEAEKEAELQADVAETEPFTVMEISGPDIEPETAESREETEPEEKDKLHVDAVNTEHGQVIEIAEEDTSVVASHTGGAQIPEKEATSEKSEPDKGDSRDEREPVKVKLRASEIVEEHTSAPVSHMGSVQMPPLSEEAVPDELKEEPEFEPEKELHEDEREQEAKVLVVEEAARDSEMATIQTPERKLSDGIQPTDTVSKDTTEHLTVSKVSTEDEIRKPLVEDDQRTLALGTAQIQRDVDEIRFISETTAESQTLTDKPKKETEPLTEVNVEAKTEHVQEPKMLEAAQVAQLVLQERSVILDDTRAAVKDEPAPATEGNTEVEEERPGGEQVLPCDDKDIVTETEISTSGCVTEIVECATAQETEEQLWLEDLNSPGTDEAIASAKDEPEDEVRNVSQDSEIKDQTTEISPQDVQIEEEHSVPEVVGKFLTLSAVHVSNVTEEKDRAHVLGKTVIPEKTPAPCLDNARVTYEPKHEVHLGEVRGLIEREHEGELPGLEIKTSTVVHAVVAQVTTCNLKEVSPAMPDVLTQQPSNVCEPSIELDVGELELKQEAENAKPLVHNDKSETATEGSVVVTMHVSSAEFGDNHRIQVQAADVHLNSAGMNVDSVLEVGVTETKEAIDVCHETIEVTEKLSASEGTEEELMNGENKTTHHRVIQHVKEGLPEMEVEQTSCQDEAVNLEHKQPDETELSEMAENKSHEAEKQTTDSSGTVGQKEATVAEQLVTEAIRDHKEDSEEHKMEPKKYEAGVTAEGVKSPSEGLEIRRMNQESIKSRTVTVGNTGLEIPQNTGVISSIGNLESPSSLSLEFKLNIQFGQLKTPATEKTEAVKQSNVSETGIQAVERLNGANENHKKPEMRDVTVQATEITEPEHMNQSTTERAVIMKQPVLLDIGIQSVEAAQPVEQVKSTERLDPSEMETDKIKAVMQAKTFLSQPVLYEACYEEITVEEPVKQIEEENEQDLWVDAEEHIQTQEESPVSAVREEEPVAPHIESDEEEKAEPEHKFEMAPETTPKPETEEEEREKEMCATKNEAEAFAVALEHPEAAKAAPTD